MVRREAFKKKAKEGRKVVLKEAEGGEVCGWW